ncbi:adenylate/guanylate cyclase domain-containing protein [Fulvivirga maritima]|uniref:adenylate/guanylate cyclase domain-containing protein n=1 Tax=Fulvivirga maritima TaxID=2904247 RepID=UPI001F207B1B|nr:adenylate/guanylate cyclase domain-containing protein [Fulvivirga maritima]UII25626.1 adenylate/guanylate cyclase domain-containing protein [Fulvivirga maritima]
MSKKIEYTTFANRFSSKYPLLSYLGIQVNFWVIANLLLATIIILYNKVYSLSFHVNTPFSNIIILAIAVLFGHLYGISYGLLGYYLDKGIFKKKPIGKIILIKAIGSLSLLIVLIYLLHFILTNIPQEIIRIPTLQKEIWDYIFYLMLVYFLFMSILINYINVVNKKYGPGILVPILFGRYRKPREENRIFMFMDLQSSTSTAEALGHLKYSAYIRDCFDDINDVLFSYRAQIYQYVGDEIVVTWPEQEGLIDNCCILFYFACKRQFQDREAYYIKNYGVTPTFKAGLHGGIVSAVEIGEIKKDIAYHGDTINTASRIQSICNQYNKSFLTSEYISNIANSINGIKSEQIGEILLRGKTEPIAIFSIEEV